SQSKIKWISLAVFLVINLLIWQRLFSFSLRDDLKVVFLDVGQGDAVFIETKNGNQVLIDGGPNDKVLRELSKFMSFFDRSIDMIIATHPDSDHIGGLVGVLNRFDNDIYLESGVESDTLVYSSLENTLEKEKNTRIIAKRGMIFDLGNSVQLEVLFPDGEVSGFEPNTASIITQIKHEEVSFMLTGDSPASIERYLVSIDGKGLKSDVLKAGHHGSKTSSSEVFLGFVSPTYSVVSAEEDNRYGHPHKEVLDRLSDFEINILETSKDGSIVFLSNGEEVRVK
ncbi:MAG: MBL fold metallo-hydrolase, partial [Candidatus Pacebacteria bacterium]|nr:MBL fold metallo-hydrolase [Candidatus Paceibacterota bacterium]